MEALEDLLSDTDGEGAANLNLRHGAHFSFAAIRQQLAGEDSEVLSGKALDKASLLPDRGRQAPEEAFEEEDEDLIDAQLSKGLWDISSLGLGRKKTPELEEDDIEGELDDSLEAEFLNAGDSAFEADETSARGHHLGVRQLFPDGNSRSVEEDAEDNDEDEDEQPAWPRLGWGQPWAGLGRIRAEPEDEDPAQGDGDYEEEMEDGEDPHMIEGEEWPEETYKISTPKANVRDADGDATPEFQASSRSPGLGSPNSAGRRGLSEDELCAHSALVGGPNLNSPTRAGMELSADLSEKALKAPQRAPARGPGRPTEARLQAKSNELDDQPIKASGSYRTPPPISGAPLSGVSEASTALPDDVASSSAMTAGSATSSSGKRPFLKKGARMQRSSIPASGSTEAQMLGASRPSSESRNTLRLNPRATSEPAAARMAKSPVQNGMQDADTMWSFSTAAKPVPSEAEEPVLEGGYGARARQAAAQRQLDAGMDHSSATHASPSDDWADSTPWDRRQALDLDLELEEDASLSLDEPPTSDIVRSYFHTSASSTAPASRAAPARHNTHWEGSDAFSALYGRSSASSPEGSSGSCANGRGRGRGRHAAQLSSRAARDFGPEPASEKDAEEEATLAEEARKKLAALDQELKKYEKENDLLKKLQAQAEQAEREISRDREKLWREVEAEKTALHAEFDVERASMRKERRRLSQTADRQRQQLLEDKEAAEERRRLQERTEQLEEEMREKEKRWQRTVDRLQRQIGDLTRKNAELQDEVKRANQQAVQAQFTPSWQETNSTASGSRRSTSAAAAGTRKRGVSLGSSSSTTSVAQAQGPSSEFSKANPTSTTTLRGAERPTARPKPSTQPAAVKPPPAAVSSVTSPTGSNASSASTTPTAASAVPAVEVRETRNLDGRIERLFTDGRREVEFANGLRKVMWPDGQTSVMFQNGDLKEIRADGVVVYHYRATGAVQTTFTDGTETYRFSDGQSEQHCTDGSKEIRFPNGTVKKIAADGAEEVIFADGTVRRTPASS